MFAAALLWLLAFLNTAPPPGFTPFAITATPITEFRLGSDETRFGEVTFLGGLEVASPSPDFGGLSGIDFLPDSRTLLAVADTGFFLRATLDETPGQRPVALRDVAIAQIPTAVGSLPPTIAKFIANAEALRIVATNGAPTALVTFELLPTLRAFAGPDFAAANPERIPLPAFVDRMPPNAGLESLAVAPATSPLAGANVIIAERALDAAGNHRGFILSGPEEGTFALTRTGDFDITDAAFLPSGDLLILERSFMRTVGRAMRLRLIPARELHAGATVEGRTLLEADDRAYAVDNMEALAVRALPDGSAILTVVSDDNGSPEQRTLLLQFRLSQ